MTKLERLPGARALPAGGTRFSVWAPLATRVELQLNEPDELLPLASLGEGWHGADVASVAPGRRYGYRLDGSEPLPDPASMAQPDGVHGLSAVIDPGFPWHDGGWRGVPLDEVVLYELHVGTFTPEGTFDAVIGRLDAIAELGVTMVELMPVAQFPGTRNWGYDGVFPYAAQWSYGGPDGLRRLVEAAHRAGVGVCLDVVYNHVGPEGNVLHRFGPYFTDRHRTPWGDAVNVDGPGSDAVRSFLVGNALWWLGGCHVDALRLDAVHAIVDESDPPFLGELSEAVARLEERGGRALHLFAESPIDDPRMLEAATAGGMGMDAQWCDDFHHALHWRLTGEDDGYYAGFACESALVEAWRQGFVRNGASRSTPRRGDRSSGRLVVYSQNHDQVGNRMLGERLIELAGPDAARLAALAVLAAPFLPLLFMGEEYGERSPFQYFVSHGDPSLVDAVRRGRREEFSDFAWRGEPPDPQSEETFRRSVLDWDARARPAGKAMLRLYGELLRLRRERPALRRPDPARAETSSVGDALWARRWEDGDAVALCINAGAGEAELEPPFPGRWTPLLDTADARFGGPGAGGRAASGRLRVAGRSAVVLGAEEMVGG